VILRAERIAALLREGRKTTAVDPLVITPTPDLDALAKSGSASVDLRLGTWFLSLRHSRMSHVSVKQPGSPAQLTKTHYVTFGETYYLHPKTFVLAVTLEWIRVPSRYAAYVVGKSSWGRRGLIIATATGVHPGYKGCLTLELSNVGELPIAVQPGISICQLFFHRAEGTGSHVDRSAFVGLRKPTLGDIEPDEVARLLADAAKLH
jgi:dCTP deaminase